MKAETKTEQPTQQQPTQQPTQEKPAQEKLREIIRILHTDIPGKAKIYSGLTHIKGISWSVSNAVCYILGINKQRRAGSLTDEEIKKIELTLKNLHSYNLPAHLFNRQRTTEGKPIHFLTSDLELQLKTDIKSLREIQSYKGIRHALGLPVRGQRTRSHFRHGKTMGVSKKKLKQKVGTKKPESKEKKK